MGLFAKLQDRVDGLEIELELLTHKLQITVEALAELENRIGKLEKKIESLSDKLNKKT